MDSQDLDASLLVEQVLDEFDINCMRDDDDEEEEQLVEDSSDDEEEIPVVTQTQTLSQQSTTTPQSTTPLSFDLGHLKEEKGVVFVSIDLETGGDAVGIIQLSAVAFDLHHGGQPLGIFNEYVKPTVEAKYWSQAAIAVHNITPSSPEIQSASSLDVFWQEFVRFIEHLDNYKSCVMVAWSGASCDVEWLFRVTEEAVTSNRSMPSNLKFFMDPSTVMEKYVGCKLNNKWTGCLGYGLEETWCHIKQQTFMNVSIAGFSNLPAHNSLADAAAQMDVVLDPRFQTHLDKKLAIRPMEELFQAKRKKRQATAQELNRKVPIGWTEDNTTTFTPCQSQQYTGYQGGGVHGPTSAVLRAMSNGTSNENKSVIGNKLVNLFLFFLPISLLTYIANETERYTKGEWVQLVRSGRSFKFFKSCERKDDGARHRIQEGDDWVTVTIDYIMAWLVHRITGLANRIRPRHLG